MADFYSRPRAMQWNNLSKPRASHAEILAVIGRELRVVYARLVEEPIPEHLEPYVERLFRRDQKAAH